MGFGDEELRSSASSERGGVGRSRRVYAKAISVGTLRNWGKVLADEDKELSEPPSSSSFVNPSPNRLFLFSKTSSPHCHITKGCHIHHSDLELQTSVACAHAGQDRVNDAGEAMAYNHTWLLAVGGRRIDDTQFLIKGTTCLPFSIQAWSLVLDLISFSPSAP